MPEISRHVVAPFRLQLLKWVGNKQRFAHEIASYLPSSFGTYFEPFIGSGAVLGTLHPPRAVASDIFGPLIDIWRMLRANQDELVRWYRERWARIGDVGKNAAYAEAQQGFNSAPNGPDLLFICRACYGGVVRFRQADGHLSTPCGVHDPITPESFAKRVAVWHARTAGATFHVADFEEAMAMARPGDVVYCDPPYTHTQSILYGAQAFSLDRLFRAIESCRARNVYVALSIDGSKRSGEVDCDLPIPPGLFEREVRVNCGRSMLKRFQMEGRSLENEEVADRLLLTY